MSLSHTGMLKTVHHAEVYSDNPDVQVGASIYRGQEWLLSDANRTPNNVALPHGRLIRPDRDIWLGHAEQRVIAQAARKGVKTDGCRMYVTMFPCYVCAGAIINAGITRVTTRHPDMDKDEKHHFTEALEMFEEAGVEIFYVD